MAHLTSLYLIPEVQDHDTLRNTITPSVDQNFIYRHPILLLNRGVDVDDLDVAIICLTNRSDVNRRPSALRYTTFRLNVHR